jgi:hypothetical protein
MRRIALELFAVGNCTVSEMVEVLSEPKSNTQTVGLLPPNLYIRAPRAVIAPFQVTLENEMYVTLLDDVGVTETGRAMPPAL